MSLAGPTSQGCSLHTMGGHRATSLHSLSLLPKLGDQCGQVIGALQASEQGTEVQRELGRQTGKDSFKANTLGSDNV